MFYIACTPAAGIAGMPLPPADDTASWTLDELCALADLPRRTVRFYVQQGLVERPLGETRGARYGHRQLEQLLAIRRWQRAGLSLARIRERLAEAQAVPAAVPAAGTVTVCSHLHVAPGVELVIEPARAGLGPEQVRALLQGVLGLWHDIERQAAGARAPGPEDSGNGHGMD